MWHHVYPQNDTKAHILEGVDCHCEPEIDWENHIVIHNAYDLREITEFLQENQKKENEMSVQSRLPLRPFIGCKIIEACEMSLTIYNQTYNKVVPATDGEDGYVVFYPDGYVSWSPKTVFEEAYRQLNKKEINNVAYYR